MAPTTEEFPGASTMRATLNQFKDFACRLADAASAVTLQHFRQPLAVDDKSHGGYFDPVTAADRLAEAAIRSLIETTYPEHGILGEETGATAGQSTYTWLIDPIDGTRSFLLGVPVWGTLIALSDGTRPVLGLADQPYLGERYIGVVADVWREAHVLSRGRTMPLRTSETTSLAHALLTCTTPALFKMEAERKAYAQLEAGCRLSRYSLDCYGYCLLAVGTIDLVVEAGLSSFDIQPLVPIVEAAGGCVTNWRGEPPYAGGQILAAANESLHEQALAILKGAASP